VLWPFKVIQVICCIIFLWIAAFSERKLMWTMLWRVQCANQWTGRRSRHFQPATRHVCRPADRCSTYSTKPHVPPTDWLLWGTPVTNVCIGDDIQAKIWAKIVMHWSGNCLRHFTCIDFSLISSIFAVVSDKYQLFAYTRPCLFVTL